MYNEENKKTRILEAGVEMLRTKGVSSTSMNDIIRESGISKGGVYHHFSSKDELLLGVCEFFFEQHMSDGLGALDTDPSFANKSAIEMIDTLMLKQEERADELDADMRLFMDFYFEAMHNETLREMFAGQYNRVLQILCGLIDEGKRQGDIRQEVDTEMLSSAMLATFDGYAIAKHIIATEKDYSRYALDTVRLLIQGART